ncbi:MAG TPA: SGNH/GDSL hydrolase family protein [Pyrinomonadaceae bacterium]|jgi:hypothetical protein
MKRVAARLLTVGLSVVVALVILEVFLRISGYSYPIFTTTDQTVGVALRPRAEGWYRKEGEAYIRISSDGLRDKEHARAKPANTVRIAVLGDSFAEALQLPQENAFWAVMEQRLGGCQALGGRAIEVINFGVSGYGTAQELLTLRHKVWQYQPDIVLLAVTTSNDIADNSRALKGEDIPYFILRNGELVLDDSFRNSSFFRSHDSLPYRFLRGASDYSRLVQGFYQARYALRVRESARPEINVVEQGHSPLVYRQPEDAVWDDAWRVTEKLILAMRDEVWSRSAKFLVVTLSNGIQVNPDADLREQFRRTFNIDDLFYPDKRIKALGERENFPVFNLAPLLLDYATQNKTYLHGFEQNLGRGHWNAAGHRVAGELIAQYICNEME